MTGRHVVLLGDSIFDNAAYVGGGPDVAAQLREALGSGWQVTLAAVDGGVIDGVHTQLRRVPADASHLVVSVGGNDALAHADLLNPGARDPLRTLARAARDFHQRYARMLEAVLRLGRPTAVCTVYEGNLGGAEQERAVAAIAVFNDRIQRAARTAGVPVIELRDICVAPEHYANPIEPSVAGGQRIAAAIAALLTA